MKIVKIFLINFNIKERIFSMKIGEMFVINFEFFPRNRSGARTNLLPEFSSEEMIPTRKIEI